MKEDELVPVLLRVSSACRMVSVCLSSGYKFAADGTWPSVRIGKSIRIPYDGLMDWIADLSNETDNESNS